MKDSRVPSLAALARSAWLALTSAGLVVACGSGTPVGGSFTLDFPTVADAVAADSVQVFVYPFSTSNSCESLVESRRTNAMSPAGFTTETQPATPCSLMGGSGSLSVGFGSYSFLAVAQKSGTDFLIGCAAQTLSDTNSNVGIPLTLASETASVPATSCSMLSTFCSKKCM
jgi:hypothetical protein